MIRRGTLVAALAAATTVACSSAHRYRDPDEATLPDGGPDADAGPGSDGSVATDAAAGVDASGADADVVVEEPCLLEAVDVVQVAAPPEWEADAPEVVWNGEDLSVLFFSSGGTIPHPVVSLARVSLDMASVSEPVTVGEESHGWGEAAWNGEALGLCWHSDPGFEGRAGFRLHGADGARLGERVDLDMDGEACLALAASEGRFLAAWRHYARTEEEVLIATWIQVLDETGAAVADPVELAPPLEYPGRSVEVAADPGGGFLAAYSLEDEVRLARVSPAGEVTEAARLPAPEAGHANVAARGGRLALVWLTGPRWQRQLHLAVLEAATMAVLAERAVTPELAGASDPQVLPFEGGWVLTWHEGPDDWERADERAAMLLHLDADGTPRQPRLALRRGPSSGYGGPSPAAAGRALYVGISYPEDPAWWEQVFLHRLECATAELDVCAPQDAAVPATLCDDPRSIGWRWTGSGCEELLLCAGECTGADCGALARTEWDCLADRGHC